MSNPKENNNDASINWLLAILLIFAVVLILGYLLIREIVDSNKRKQERIKDLKKYREDLIAEQIKLKALKENAAEQLAQVERNFQIFYIIFRILITALWVSAICLFNWCNKKEFFDSALQLNAIIAFGLVLLNFLFYDRVLDFKEVLGEVKELIKNTLFKKSLKLKGDIYQYNVELDKVELRLDAVERELKDLGAPI